jgi:hypothetical protein
MSPWGINLIYLVHGVKVQFEVVQFQLRLVQCHQVVLVVQLVEVKLVVVLTRLLQYGCNSDQLHHGFHSLLQYLFQYAWSSEAPPTGINEVEFKLTAEPHHVLRSGSPSGVRFCASRTAISEPIRRVPDLVSGLVCVSHCLARQILVL